MMCWGVCVCVWQLRGIMARIQFSQSPSEAVSRAWGSLCHRPWNLYIPPLTLSSNLQHFNRRTSTAIFFPSTFWIIVSPNFFSYAKFRPLSAVEFTLIHDSSFLFWYSSTRFTAWQLKIKPCFPFCILPVGRKKFRIFLAVISFNNLQSSRDLISLGKFTGWIRSSSLYARFSCIAHIFFVIFGQMFCSTKPENFRCKLFILTSTCLVAKKNCRGEYTLYVKCYMQKRHHRYSRIIPGHQCFIGSPDLLLLVACPRPQQHWNAKPHAPQPAYQSHPQSCVAVADVPMGHKVVCLYQI